MPHWQVLTVGATCVLIAIQAVLEKLLLHAAALGQSIPSSSLHPSLRHGTGLLQAGQTEDRTSPRLHTGHTKLIHSQDCKTVCMISSA
ncbi:hypothetical protein EXN66_Car020374 [Channa argus]|uniref:Uncharacterized protein n=1 Tax=Channa argus TaxID=215402 RepID=A0A6G1QQC2_CHAAH|nr:hypothetical protein EXN66_Car020374 [Channa argus]